jgi:hypothetical protein
MKMPSKPTLRQLRRWHRQLSRAHAAANAVSDEAAAILPNDGGDLTIIMDPIIELHAALCCIEGLIDERAVRASRDGSGE